MASVLSLLVHAWVPVGVVEDDTVSSCKVDSDSSTSSGRDKAEDLLVVIEPIHKFLSILNFHWAIKSDIYVAVQVEELLEHIKHLGHLGEDDHLRAFVVQSLQQLS